MKKQSKDKTIPSAVQQLSKAKMFIFLAAGLSFLLSVYMFFSGDKQNGIFIGIWVPSILSAGTLLIGGYNYD